LLDTGIEALKEEIERLEYEVQARKEMEEKERLAPLAAREKALKNIEDDRKRMKEKQKYRVRPAVEIIQ
jgi:cell shape-determining protein MreC